MSTQIDIRLPDAVIEFIDTEVGAGRSPSRSAFILRALEREHRRCIAKRRQAGVVEEETGAYVGYRSVLWTASATPWLDQNL